MWRSMVEHVDGRLRTGALANAWSAMVADHLRARDWAEAWEALEPALPVRATSGRGSTTV